MKSPCSPPRCGGQSSSPVEQRCIQVPGHPSLNGMRQKSLWQCRCHCIGYSKMKWQQNVCISHCILQEIVFFFSICLWKLSSTLDFYWSWYYFINANAFFFFAHCLLFCDFLWSFVTVFYTDSLVQIYDVDHRLVETEFSIVNQNNAIWSIKTGGFCPEDFCPVTCWNFFSVYSQQNLIEMENINNL